MGIYRQRAKLLVEVDLDPVPGWGHGVEDWQALLQRSLTQLAPHYNPVVTVLSNEKEQHANR
jgi:hypothetical protein